MVTQLESAVSIDSKNVSLRKTNIGHPENSSNNSSAKQCIERTEECISPADHLALQSLRSSALARKTNTTTKFSRNCRNLFADLMFGEEQQKKQVEDENREKADSNVSSGDKFSAVSLEGSKQAKKDKENKGKLSKLVTEEEDAKNLQKQMSNEGDNNIEKKFNDEENINDKAKDLTQSNNESVNDKEDAKCKRAELIKQKEPVEGELIARGPIRANFIVQ